MAQLMSIKRNLEVSPGIDSVPAIFHVSQGDKGTRIILGLLNNSQDYTIPSGTTATIRGSRSDGTLFTEFSAEVETTEIKFNMPEEMASVPGPVWCEAVMASGSSNVTATANFIIDVEPSPTNLGSLIPGTDAGWTWLLGKLSAEQIAALNGESVIDAIDGKLDKELPTSQEGKYLKVNSEGVIEPSDIDSVPVDDTLSVEGAAADAKETGDALATKAPSATIAPEFSASTAYNAGDMVYKNGVLYRFTAAHSGAWTGNDVINISVADEVYNLFRSIGDLDALETEDNSSLVAAINEVLNTGGGGTVVSYSVTNTLKNVITSNQAVSVRENRSYTATLSLTQGATLSSVSVSMGGVDITATAWNSATMAINIASVTGDIVIIAKANVIIEQTVTWSGSGQDKTASPKIDASDYDVYFEIPFEEGASGLSGTAADGGNAVAFSAYLYSLEDDSALGWYDYLADEIKIGGAWTNRPTMTFGNRIMIAPHGYKIELRCSNNKSAFTSNSSCNTYLNTYATTVTLVSPDEEPEPEPELSNAESVDRDLLQVYSVRSLSTETISDSTTYEGVIEEAKNDWMLEYSGNINKIPLIIHTDQHDEMGDAASKSMWETIDSMVSWYDISKVINLGDTTNSYDNFDDPTLGDHNLEEYLEATENIPFSKRIEVFGNHDCMKIINASLTYVPDVPKVLNQYFKNVMARRTSNNGYHVTYDPYFNVKYIVLTGYDYVDATHYDIVSSEQYEFLIKEMTKNDGYDIIVCSHQEADIYREATGQLIKARCNKTSGTFTDRLEVSHTYDFTNCENDLIVCLHGHSHSDRYTYDDLGILSQSFDNYYDTTRPIFFVIVDREDRQLKVWKVLRTPAYTTYTRPLDKPEDEPDPEPVVDPDDN